MPVVAPESQITGLAVGVAAFLVAFVLVSPHVVEHEKRAIRLYNARAPATP